MTTTQLQAKLELRNTMTPTLRRIAEQIEIVTDKPKGRLLQVGDLVDYHGRRGTVAGVDAQDDDTELRPMVSDRARGRRRDFRQDPRLSSHRTMSDRRLTVDEAIASINELPGLRRACLGDGTTAGGETMRRYDVTVATEADAAAITLLGKIATAAIEVDRLRQLKTRAARSRAGYQCLHECKVIRGGQDPPDEFRDPCWKAGHVAGDDWVRLPESEWCDPCVRRGAAHREFCDVRNELAGARRRLTYHVRRYRREYGDA